MLKLTFGATRNPRLQPMMDGSVKPQNIELQFVIASPPELFFRNLKYNEFDVFEMSLSEYLITKDRRDASRWRWSGLPVFFSKASIWLTLSANTEAQIHSPKDLVGKRVGVPDYPMTAALWMRIVLQELYGVRPQDIRWYNGRLKELSHSGILELDKNPPRGISLTWLAQNQAMDVMLEKGELDAAFGLRPGDPEAKTFTQINRYGGAVVQGNPKIRRLFPDGGRQITTDYYNRVGFVPPSHMIVVQERILRDNPWVALELYKACQRSKDLAYERARQMQSTYLLFEGNDYARQAALFGPDPYPLGIQMNKHMLAIISRSSFEEGLLKKEAKIEELFPSSLWDT